MYNKDKIQAFKAPHWVFSQLGWDTGHTGQAPDLNPASIGNRICPQNNHGKLSQLHAMHPPRPEQSITPKQLKTKVCNVHFI